LTNTFAAQPSLCEVCTQRRARPMYAWSHRSSTYKHVMHVIIEQLLPYCCMAATVQNADGWTRCVVSAHVTITEICHLHSGICIHMYYVVPWTNSTQSPTRHRNKSSHFPVYYCATWRLQQSTY